MIIVTFRHDAIISVLSSRRDAMIIVIFQA